MPVLPLLQASMLTTELLRLLLYLVLKLTNELWCYIYLEQWFTTTIPTAACGSHAPFVRHSPVFNKTSNIFV